MREILLVLCLGFLQSAFGQNIVLSGQCNPNIAAVPNFLLSNFLGQWYEIERYPQSWQTGQCNRALYTAGVGNNVGVLNTQVLSQNLLSQSGTAVVNSPQGAGRLTVTFNVNGIINTADILVLATDYTSYALLYSCRNINNLNMQVSSWKLSRSRKLSTVANNAINNFIAVSPFLNQTYYQITDQSPNSCFYVPPFNANQEVRVRGTCDNIVGQTLFDLNRYLGWWHEISSYPTGTDGGTCVSTSYVPDGNGISFETTRVFGLTGQVTKGSVELLENGRLRRSWLVNGTVQRTQDFWVLGTDYTSYSVELTCVPADSDYVRVWSTQQSRTRSLTPAAVQAISFLISAQIFLINSFFVPVSQTDASCFHYPEQTGLSVVLPGQCDPNIPIQPNFNIASYAGTWYQIERYAYPDVLDSATCIGTRYTNNVNTGAVTVLNWEIWNGTLWTITGQATVLGANLAITLPNDNASVTTNLQILTTDYTSFALAYTCQNINQFQRAVVAFKLSRGRNMTAAATTAIDAFMATRQELHQPYFISVAQDVGCRDPSSSYLIKSSISIILLGYVISMLV